MLSDSIPAAAAALEKEIVNSNEELAAALQIAVDALHIGTGAPTIAAQGFFLRTDGTSVNSLYLNITGTSVGWKAIQTA